jgi:hypothetical protein
MRRHSRTLRFGAILALGATAAVTLAAAASAGPPFKGTFHFEGTDLIDDLCGVEGLNVAQDFVIDGRFQAGPKGSDGLVFFLQLTRHTEVITNLANGRFVTSVTPSVLEKDLRVTDNGDGTLTVLVLATGNATLYGEDGKAIGRNPGQVRIELLLDHGGTPNDPNDDVLLSEEVVKDSTGRSDDFCETVVPALS